MSNSTNEFYSGLLAVLEKNGIKPETRRSERVAYSNPTDHQKIDTWRHGTVTIESAVKVLMSSGEITVDVTLKPKTKNEDSAKDVVTYFEILRKDKEVIDKILGAELDWNPRPPRERQIILKVPCNLSNETDWANYHEILAAKLVAFRIAFKSRIERLP